LNPLNTIRSKRHIDGAPDCNNGAVEFYLGLSFKSSTPAVLHLINSKKSKKHRTPVSLKEKVCGSII